MNDILTTEDVENVNVVPLFTEMCNLDPPDSRLKRQRAPIGARWHSECLSTTRNLLALHSLPVFSV